VGEYSLAKIKEFEAEDKVKAGANLGAVCIKVPMNLYQSKVKPAKGV
jgi:hypothetical protein